VGQFQEGVLDELKLYVRQSAWLAATPGAPKKKDEQDRRCRLKRLQDRGSEPELPPVELGHLVDYLFEVGPVMQGGFGPVALTHGELRAWQDNVGLELQPWECRALIQLSKAYCAEFAAASDPAAPAPWTAPEVAPEELARVADDLRESMRRMAK
jgi:hypothetical protein